METVGILDVTVIEPKLKHSIIFQKFDDLETGDAFIIHNDHDPKPLYYQLLAERGNIFSWQYLEEGPQWWKVKIEKHNVGEDELTIGDQVSEEQLVKPTHDYNNWELDFLADYIINTHHKYVLQAMPEIFEYTQKVAKFHGERHPEVFEIANNYVEIMEDLKRHMMKEENVLFPYIKILVSNKKKSVAMEPSPFGTIQNPIRMMEMEHEEVGNIMGNIAALSNNYTAPADACTTLRLAYAKLKEFEEDLHQHIHLENNILFPRAVELERGFLD